MKKDWYEGDVAQEEDSVILEYDITSSPNDFNVKTIYDFIESGSVKIPEFQRNYVWDIRRASKFIESIIMNLPIPQIFLYEEARNRFLVIDGQQRLMTIYYFIKQRFPRKEKRAELRRIFDENGKIPDSVLADDNYFTEFSLKLKDEIDETKSKLDELVYFDLGEYKVPFELRPIRNVIIKQNKPENDDSSKYEIFSRLNTGGINLNSQEIRASIFQSDFYDMLFRINLDERWRKLIGLKDEDPRMKDIEILLRGFGMLISSQDYKPPMTRFLNKFSKSSLDMVKEKIAYLEKLFGSFLDGCSKLREKAFFSKGGKFNISVFESVFYATCDEAFKKQKLVSLKVDNKKLDALKNNQQFIDATQSRLSSKQNVDLRLKLAKEILLKTN